jgi:hypothetical protein
MQDAQSGILTLQFSLVLETVNILEFFFSIIIFLFFYSAWIVLETFFRCAGAGMHRSEPPVPWCLHPAGQRFASRNWTNFIWIRNELIRIRSLISLYFGYGFVPRIGLYEDVYRLEM